MRLLSIIEFSCTNEMGRKSAPTLERSAQNEKYILVSCFTVSKKSTQNTKIQSSNKTKIYTGNRLLSQGFSLFFDSKVSFFRKDPHVSTSYFLSLSNKKFTHLTGHSYLISNHSAVDHNYFEILVKIEKKFKIPRAKNKFLSF